MTEAIDRRERIKRQIEQLLAQDLSEMGYQVRRRQQQRIDALRTEYADAATEPVSVPATGILTRTASKAVETPQSTPGT